ncbi:MAG: transporter [Candidatus Thermoplasmatota archaeon]|nr:transporter [Candidatus Thermoplasmatota archaeon]
MANDRRLLWVISYHHACNDGTLMALVAVLPILMDEMDLSYSEVGILGLGLLITVVVQFFVGKASDRRFSRYMLEVGAVMMAASFLLIPLVSDFLGLFIVVIAMRVGASFYHPVGVSWITREYQGPYLDTALGVQSGVGNLGVIIALGSSGFLGEYFGWKAPCILWAFVNLLAVAMGLALTRGYEPAPEREHKARAAPARSTFKKIAGIALPIATGGAFYQVTTYFGPINLTQAHGWSTGDADLMFATWICVGTLTSYLFGRISERYGRARILKYGYVTGSAAVFLLSFMSSWYLILPTLLVFGAVFFLTYPALFGVASNATDVSERGTAFGILFGLQLGGGAIVVAACGMISDMFNDPSYSFIIMGVLGIASVTSLMMLGEDKGR